jgi:hypothetical protein
MKLAAGLLLLVALPLLAPRAAAAPQGETRTQASLAEDQALLLRQMKRLRSTMELLAQRFEAEGRKHAAELLRQGLKHLDERRPEFGDKTLEELMGSSQQNIAAGMSVQALETQQRVIEGLEKLYRILTDRMGLEDLQKSLESLQKIRADLQALAAREHKLSEDAAKLQQDQLTPEQKQLANDLAAAEQQQRELRAETEKNGREQRNLDLEALRAERARIVQDQLVDAAVARSWSPEDAKALHAADAPLRAALESATHAERLAKAAGELRSAAGELRDPAAAKASAQKHLESAAGREERAAQASSDPAATKAAAALRGGAEDVAAAADQQPARDAAAQALEQRAQALEQAAQTESAAAEKGRAQAQKSLEANANSQSGAAQAAQRALKALGQEQKSGPGQEQAAQAALEKGKSELDAAESELEQLGTELARSENEQSARTRTLGGQVPNAVPQGGESASKASAALERAAAAQQSASQAAAQGDPQKAAAQAAAAEEALHEAQKELDALAAAKESQSANSAAMRALAEKQKQLRESVAKLSQKPGAPKESASALDEAQKAMERAAGDLSLGQTGEASRSQGEALDALQRAQRASSQPSGARTPEQEQKSKELAAEQEKVQSELAALAERNRKRENSQPAPSLDRAQQSAGKAKQSLEEGDTEQAQEQTQQTEREMEQAQKELGQEEEQYQRLRQEELLFRIAEEVKQLTEEHKLQMSATLEVDQARPAGEKPTHTQRLRLKKIAKAESTLGARATEIEKAIAGEGSLVFAEILEQVQSDLARIGKEMGEEGDYQSGERVQVLQQDVAESLAWLTEALAQEKERRKQEPQPPSDSQSQNQQQRRQLVPDAAELKLMKRLELEIQDSLAKFKLLHPEVEQGRELDPLLYEDLQRLAWRHQRTSDLFEKFRKRLGIPDPEVDKP